jgi:glycosyltransferase involved in cell wall biosynthesis
MLYGMAVEKIKGLVSLATNDPNASTGYGVQAKHLIGSMKEHGMQVAVLSNYGTEAKIDKYRTKHGEVPLYPKGLLPYSDDVMELWHNHHRAQYPELPHAIVTLYDVWVYNNMKAEVPIISWVPLDHITMPPLVHRFLERDNVTPVAMSLHGQRQLKAAGFDAPYIPHSVDTNVFKRTAKLRGKDTRTFMDIPADYHLTGMVLANKANKILHRKAYAEQLLAWGIFHKDHPKSHLYIHADPSIIMGGFDLGNLIKACGIPEDAVTIANRNELLLGYSDADMAALYSAFDVLLMATYGEGFGVPMIEAASCSVRTIASSWAATQDLVTEDCWLVEGQPFWDEAQKSFFQIPLLGSIVAALEKSYEAPRGPSIAQRKFALDFDTKRVWERDWLPFFRDYFA